METEKPKQRSDAEVDAASGIAELSGLLASHTSPPQPQSHPTATAAAAATTTTAQSSALKLQISEIPTELSALVPQGTIASANAILARVGDANSALPSDRDRFMAAVCAFCAAAARPFCPAPKGVPLSTVASSAGLSLASLLESVRTFAVTANLQPTALQRLAVATKWYVVDSLLSEKYARILGALFSNDAAHSANVALLGRLGWMLFLLAPRPEPDLCSGMFLLLCCASFVYGNAPIALCRTAQGGARLSLEWLCRSCEAGYREVLEVQVNVFTPFVQVLISTGSLSARQHDVTRSPATAGDDGGVTDAQVTSSIAALDALYEATKLISADFDERLFVTARDRAGDLSAFAQDAQNYWRYHATPTKVPATPKAKPKPAGVLLTPMASAAKKRAAADSPPVPATPMRATFATLSWFGSLSSHDKMPTSTVAMALDAAQGEKLCADVAQKVAALMERVVLVDAPSAATPSKPSVRLPVDPTQRSRLCVQTFHRLLESLLARALRTDRAIVAELLSSDDFVRSLLAVSIEMVAYANKVVTMDFPRVLGLLDVPPLEFLRIIGNVLSLGEPIPDDVVAHLKRAEGTIIESLVWANGAAVAAKLKQLPPAGIRAISRSLFQNVLASPASTAKVPTTLRVLVKRLFAHCYRRLAELANDCELPLRLQMWDVLVHIVAEKAEMLPDHTVTQIVLCVAHAVLCANSRPANFRDVISKHRIPKAVWGQVSLGDGKTGDLVKYYNDVFVPAVFEFVGKTYHHYSTVAASAATLTSISASSSATTTATAAATSTAIATPMAPPPMQAETPRATVPRTPDRRPGMRVLSGGAAVTPVLRVTETPMRLISPRYKFGQSPKKDIVMLRDAVAGRSSAPQPGKAAPSSGGLHVRKWPGKVLSFDSEPAPQAAATPPESVVDSDTESTAPEAKRQRPTPESTPTPGSTTE